MSDAHGMHAAIALSMLQLVWFAAPALGAEGHAHTAPAAQAVLLEGLGTHRHPIATRVPDAQRFFDQGLALVFAFNHDEAIRAFRRAAELDPRATMPWWGMALAYGPNINMPADPTRERAAWEALQRARTLARRAPPAEQAYVEALAPRYAADPSQDPTGRAAAYAKAMAALVRRYPDDLDAATLWAESMMDLRPWQQWTLDGRPAEGTETILAVLEGVLRRDPNHPGANHYYIHAVEASPHPERAIASATRLETLVPGAGHLVHMPSHVWIRTGAFEAAARSNERAIAADRAYFAAAGGSEMYALMYYAHNIHFLAASEAMAGRSEAAGRAARELATTVGQWLGSPLPPLDAMTAPAVEMLLSTPLWVSVRGRRWDEVLAAPEPPAVLPVTRGLWHYARGEALVATGRSAAARAERAQLGAARAALPAGAGLGFNTGDAVLGVAELILSARLAQANGRRDDAIAYWRDAVAAQDALAYNEPPDWYYPVRESLGGALLRAGRPVEAEQVFRDDLVRNPRNGRSLLGLTKSLEAQRRAADAAWVAREFDAAWAGADSTLDPKEL